MNAATRQFIESHLNDDVCQLALSKFPDDVDKALALNQIEARQILSKKVPSWASNPDLLFPKHLSIEQCSSELTAKYKASLVENGDVFVDLTGGLGIDLCFLSEKFKTSYYVENQKELCDLAEHNFAVLGRKITIVNSDAETFINAESLNEKCRDTIHRVSSDLIFIDPARRDVYNRKMVSLHDCSPDVVDLVEMRHGTSQHNATVMIKLSPMLDISVIINELPNIAEIHIVAVKNECKEVLVLLRPDYNGEITIHCVDLFPVGTRHALSLQYAINDESVAIPTFAATIKKYLYEPNAAIMKAGAFKLVSQRFGIDKLHINSHLYTSDNLISDFPGRIFEVVVFAPFSKKIKKELLKDISEASVAVRNFPLSANELRKSLNLKESDENFVFGTTMMGEKKVVIYCKRI